MPHILVLVAAGVGLFSAYKWITREASKAPDAASKAHEDALRQAHSGAAGGIKDLGELVWDEKAGAYRPKRPS